MNSDTLQSLWTDERILDLVRKLRNDLIKDFLDERILVPWLKDRYQVPDLSPVKVQLIRKELKTLLISPVDIHHYQSLIEHVRTTGSAGISGGYEPLFYDELTRVFRRYLYIDVD
jgi:hypothetical protein